MGGSLRNCMESVARRYRNILILREDNLTALRHFLAGRGYVARLVNACFNLFCKFARVNIRFFKRIRTKKNSPATDITSLPCCDASAAPFRRRCALIAETSVPQCLHYRVKERAAQLRHLGWAVEQCSWHDFDAAMRALQLSSCVIFYRVPMLKRVPELFAEARRLGLPIIFDIDDLIFDRTLYADYLRSQTLEGKEINGLLNLADMYRKSMDAADTLMASTLSLGELLPSDKGKKPCFVVHNSVADSLHNIAQGLCDRPARDDGEIRMFYGSGSRTHDADFALIAEALLEAMRENAHLHLYLHGYLELIPDFENCAERVHHITFLDKQTYYQVIAEYDIALMPLEASIFNDAKSNIKYQEASIFGIPSIVSPCADFVEAVTDGVDGFIAHNSAQWHSAILKLAASHELRVAMGKKARQNVLARYGYQHVAESELSAALPVAPVSVAPRVLLVNVLFGLSSFGGATMVVEDTARELRRQGFDVYVFSTLRVHGIPQGTLVRYAWNGVTVIAFNDCLGDGEEKNSHIEHLFRRALRAVCPELVHIHCIQGMGLGLLQTCRSAKIPYVITMHDAWWICPRQFMMDKDEHYCEQKHVKPEICRARCDLSDAKLYSRRLQMREAVKRAEAIFAPSEFYAAFARRNFPRDAHKINVNRNGIHSSHGLRAPRKAGPVRFGYLGGKAYHKGYFFLAETLRSLGRTDFEVLLVDVHTAFGKGAMTGSENRHLWQDMRVSILPFMQHDAMDSVYAQLDVLLFPSLWDESFGLTVREAIVRDIFVVAADCGGPSEAIVHGENGLLFPKGDKAAFSRHLHHILDNKDVFTSYRTSNFGDVISIESQTRELAFAYERIIEREKA